MLADLKVRDFIGQTASSTPVPGGGSAAALSAALAAGLTQMVAGLTIGRKGFEAVEVEMQGIAEQAAALREKCLQNIDRDSDAYTGVIEAFRLPKGSEKEKKARTDAIQKALQHASRVPLETAELAALVIDLAVQVVTKGNPNAVTDGAVAASLARTAALGGVMNVRINLASIKDGEFAAAMARHVDDLEARVKQVELDILAGLQLDG